MTRLPTLSGYRDPLATRRTGQGGLARLPAPRSVRGPFQRARCEKIQRRGCSMQAPTPARAQLCTLCRRWSYTNPSCRSQVGPCTVPPSIACRSDCSSDCRTVRGEPRDPYVVLHQRGIGDAPISIEGTQTPSSAGRRRLNDSFPSLYSKRKAMLHETSVRFCVPVHGQRLIEL